MVLKNLPKDEMDCWVLAWGFASRERYQPSPRLSSILLHDKGNETIENMRMQGHVYEWALMGYAPAQRAWARRIAARLSCQ